MQSSTFTDPEIPAGGNGQARPNVARMRQKAADAIDSRREAVADRIESAAANLRDRIGNLPGAEKFARPADRTARFLESAADYVRDRDARGMASDAGQVVRRHPGAALLTAAAIGFLMARALTRR